MTKFFVAYISLYVAIFITFTSKEKECSLPSISIRLMRISLVTAVYCQNLESKSYVIACVRFITIVVSFVHIQCEFAFVI